jgi:sugar lactone lactonase YvrE
MTGKGRSARRAGWRPLAWYGSTLAVVALLAGACSGSNAESSERPGPTTSNSASTATSASPAEAVGTITTVAGDGFQNSTGDGGPATKASIAGPSIAGFDTQGNLFVNDSAGPRIRKIDPSGVITTVVGSPPPGASPPPGDAASVEGAGTVDAQGNLYVGEPGKLVKVTPSGDVSTAAGTGKTGFSGIGGPATKARLNMYYAGVAVAGDGTIYLTQYHYNRVLKIDRKGIITTIAGTGKPGFSGDGGPARKAQLNGPTTVSVDAAGNLYISDLENHRIRRIDTKGIITTVAGNGKKGFPDDGTAATDVPVGAADVYADAEGNFYITDEGYPGIFKVDTEGILTILAGTGVDGYSGDGGPATEAQLSAPTTVAIGPDGNLYIADWGNNRIRKVVLHAPE